MQLLMSEGEEFGNHKGLDIIKGKVKKISTKNCISDKVKIPNIGWNRISIKKQCSSEWSQSPLNNIQNNEYMYFVHSNFIEPEDSKIIYSTTNYDGFNFCSSISLKNIFACQYHPEKSGKIGLEIFRNFYSAIKIDKSWSKFKYTLYGWLNIELRYKKKYLLNNLLFIEGEKLVSYKLDFIKKLYGVNNIIKLHKEDFFYTFPRQKYLTHFNIQYSDHIVGEKYLVLKIAKPGFFNGDEEILPILDVRGAFIVMCKSVRNKISYDKLSEKDFLYSLKNIKKIGELKSSILRRYNSSLSHLSSENKIELGISITNLEYIKEINF